MRLWLFTHIHKYNPLCTLDVHQALKKITQSPLQPSWDAGFLLPLVHLLVCLFRAVVITMFTPLHKVGKFALMQ